MKTIKAGIIGGAGYAGGELIRLLIHHPEVELKYAHSRSNSGKPVASVHQDLIGDTDLSFTDKVADEMDVVFLCLGHGESYKFLNENKFEREVKIIDLSQDFRLGEIIHHRSFVYGLPELNKEKIRTAQNLANPGCFATAIQLGLLPLAKAGVLKDVYSTGITGSTGAGQKLSETSHFSWRANNIQPYKSLNHQHLKEIFQSLHQLQESFTGNSSNDDNLKFIPWRGDFTRGIFISSQLTCDLSEIELYHLYNEFYQDHPFTILVKDSISLKQVVNTNKCVIQLEKVGINLVIHSAIDNLLKGASGQAVQNMNIMFGIDECSGLNLKATAF
jgi:N-acetyl-gamma-glutamyl-phosphate reductase